MEVNLTKFSKPCSCGKEHRLFVKRVLIQKSAINELTAFLAESKKGEYPVVICDTNTYEAAAKNIFESLTNKHKSIVVLEAKKLYADEHGVEQIISQLTSKASILLAVGAGTIHDLTRYVAKEKNIPFVAVPTAASVDGFVSTVAAMTMGGFKVTYPAVSPIAVFADTEVFIKAPYRLTASGVADLLGKYTALLDWQTAHLLTDEYICERVVQIEFEAVQKVADSLQSIKKGDEAAYENLMYALILSGLAMQMTGNSRPASGSEHHLSHLWEMHVINDKTEALHGEKVGVALAIVCDTYKKLLREEEIKSLIAPYKGLPHSLLKEGFKDLYPSIIEENSPDILERVDIRRLVKQFDAFKKLVEDLPSGEQIRNMLKEAGAKVSMKDIGLEDAIVDKSITLSPFVRRRLTLMRILGSLYSKT